MQFALNPDGKMMRLTVNEGTDKEASEEVSFKLGLQFATKVIEAMTGGNEAKMREIMK